jgi:adenylylsulfate kinase-like enzyme
MIIWITGQPASGKTTLALNLRDYFRHKSCRIMDGDMFRKLTDNNDYSRVGRRLNIERIMTNILVDEHKYDYNIVSVVSPFRDQRDWIKTKTNVKEIYLKSNREREGKMVDYYSPPVNNYLHIDTDTNDVLETLAKAKEYINS